MSAIQQEVFPVERLAMLYPLNLDTVATIVLLQDTEGGRVLFPGIEDAMIEFWDTSAGPYGKPADQLLVEDRILAINCGGGMLDHHPHRDHEGQTTFTKALDRVGLGDDPRFDELRAYVIWDDIRLDTSGRKVKPRPEEGRFTWGRMVKDIQDDIASGPPEEEWQRAAECVHDAIGVYRRSFTAYVRKQTRFFRDAAPAFAAARRADFELARSDGRVDTLRLVMGNCDCDEFGMYARSRYGCGAHVVIQFRPATQHVQVTTAEWPLFEMEGLAQFLREEEIRRKDPEGQLRTNDARGTLAVPSSQYLRQEGQLPEVPEWYFIRRRAVQKGTSMLLNGTRRHRGVPPTRIPLPKIWDIVVHWLLGPDARPEPKEHRQREATRAADTPADTTPETDDRTNAAVAAVASPAPDAEGA